MIHLVVVAALIFAAVYDKDADAAQASVSYLHGDGYASGDDTRNTVRLDALAVKDWGMLYGRVDVLSFDDRNSSVVTRGVGHYGRKWHLAGQVQNQKGISQSSAGFGYSDFGKQSSWFVDAYRMQSNYYGDSLHGFAYYSRIFGKSYRATGFIEYIHPNKSDYQPVTFSQVSFQRKVNGVWIGVEHQRYFNKNGVKGLDESVNQFMIKWEF
jgi:hypothetical protein